MLLYLYNILKEVKMKLIAVTLSLGLLGAALAAGESEGISGFENGELIPVASRAPNPSQESLPLYASPKFLAVHPSLQDGTKQKPTPKPLNALQANVMDTSEEVECVIDDGESRAGDILIQRDEDPTISCNTYVPPCLGSKCHGVVLR